ncbi:MAG: hypothetical protein CYPHOPRED_004872, partial [Cyphobasidiales sp. Tagirdzhanova-0007]
MTTSLARTAGITNVPLRLLALPLCRDPELIYYYAHKRKEGRISDGGKGKKRENEEAEPSILANEAEKAGDKASDAVKNVETNSLTINMIRDEQEYYRLLAKELGTLLLGSGRGKNASPIMEDGHSKKGIMGLDEIWCMWNRARGV